jgi:hypothetical protein
MATTNISDGTHHARSSVPRIAATIVLGVLAGGVLYYATAVVGTAQIAGGFTTNPVILLGLAVVAALVVAGGWRWPVVGLSAGAMMVVVILFAIVQQVSWSSASQTLNPFEAIGYGAVSAYPAMLAAAMITASVLRRATDRKRR